jgi:hypothetical protein
VIQHRDETAQTTGNSQIQDLLRSCKRTTLTLASSAIGATVVRSPHLRPPSVRRRGYHPPTLSHVLSLRFFASDCYSCSLFAAFSNVCGHSTIWTTSRASSRYYLKVSTEHYTKWNFRSWHTTTRPLERHIPSSTVPRLVSAPYHIPGLDLPR